MGEFCLTILIILKVPYTEIDWVAYMQEVAGVLGGELDYANLRGDTGPLVYPAGFVYLYAWLYSYTGAATDMSSSIGKGQWVFFWVYLATLACVLVLYVRAGKRLVPPLALVGLCLSKRVHSIFVLRLFNDGVAALLLYAAVLLFTCTTTTTTSRTTSAATTAHTSTATTTNAVTTNRWGWGCVVFSLAVGVKMNVLLFAPGLLLLLIQAHGGPSQLLGGGTFRCLCICAFVQLALAAPFLAHAPVSYLKGAFDLGRVFMVSRCEALSKRKRQMQPSLVGRFLNLLSLSFSLSHSQLFSLAPCLSLALSSSLTLRVPSTSGP